MTNDPSILSLLASGLYACVMLACLVAAAAAMRYRQMPLHGRTWLMLAAFFVVLAALRVFAVEEALRDSVRDALRASGSYRARRDLQAPIIVAVLIVGATIGGFLLHRWSGRVRGRRNAMLATSVFAAFVSIVLIALRLTSLHMVDALLYGPFKLNWVVDLGASLIVLLASLNYVRLVRRRP